MKIVTVNVGTTSIEVNNNNWTGQESVFANGKLVSKQFSFFGSNHEFQVMENGASVDYVVSVGLNWMMVTIKIVRDGVVLLDSNKDGWLINLPIEN